MTATAIAFSSLPLSADAKPSATERPSLATTFLGAIWSFHAASQLFVAAGMLTALAVTTTLPWLNIAVFAFLLWELFHVGVGIGLMRRQRFCHRAALYAMRARVALGVIALPFQAYWIIEAFARVDPVGMQAAITTMFVTVASLAYAAVHLIGALYLARPSVRAEFERSA